MTMMSAGQAGYPAWVPRNAQLYLDHTESGLSFREIARAEGCHPSTVLRKIRAYENRRDDPLVDRGLARIGAAMQAQTADAAPPQPRTEGTDDMTAPTRTISLTDDATLRREARRVLRRLAETDAVLAVSSEMEKAVVMKGAVRMAVLERHVAEAFAIKGWIGVAKAGRVTTYELTNAGRMMLRHLFAGDLPGGGGLAEAPADFAGRHRQWGERSVEDEGQARRLRVNLTESPVAVLARRREKDGSAFLSPELVEAAERLREDFELAQIAPRVAQNWDRFLTAGDRGLFREGIPSDGAMRARDRVAAALRDLGPGLGDAALRCCCYLEGLEAAEKRMGWSARSGKIVLRIALIRLRRHYDEVYGGRRPMIG